MKKIYSYLSILLLSIGWLSSCTSAPDYGKMIPADALFVMSLNLEETAADCELGEATLLKEQLDKSLAHAKMPQTTRERLKEIMEDPQKTGFDFRQPVYVFAAPSFPNRVGILGAVSNQDDLEDFFQMMYKEGACSRVLETDGLRYATMQDVVFIFNDQWFFVAKKTAEQSETAEVLDEIRTLAAQPVEQSLQNSEIFSDMQDREGFMHLLYLGTGIEMLQDELHLSNQDLQKLLPEGVDLEKIAFICDVDLLKGEAKMVCEVLALDDRTEEWMDRRYAETSGDIKGHLVNYISDESFCYGYINIHGKGIFQQMKVYPEIAAYLETEPEKGKILEDIVNAFDGDIAFQIGTAFTQAGIPEMSVFAETKNKDWLNLVEDQVGQEVRKIDDRTYAIDIRDHRYTAYDQAMDHQVDIPVVATAVFGEKRGISYLLFGKTENMLEETLSPITLVGDYSGYFHMSANQLLNLEIVEQQLGPIAFLPFKKVVGLFDAVDLYVEKGRKTTLRILMKNKEQSPVKTIYDEVEKVLQVFA